MFKKVLILLGRSRYEVLRRAALLTAEGFSERGAEVKVLDTTVPDFDVSALLNSDYDLVFMNQAFLFDLKLPDGSNFISHIDSKVCGWIFDDVLFHYGRVLANRQANTYLLSIDGAADRIVHSMGPKINPIGHMLHGGFEAVDWKEKDIDILCPCTLGSEPKWKNEPADFERELAWEAIRTWQEKPSLSAREALSVVLKGIGENLDGGVLAGLSNVVMYVSDFMRYLCRRSILSAIANEGYNLHLIGQVDGDEKYPSNVTVHGPMNIDEVVELFARSKTVINPFPCVYEEGAHERIFTALLNRAVCFTPEYPYLHEILGDRLEYIDLNNMPDALMRIRELILNYERYKDAIEDNYFFAKKEHTWKQRGIEILEYLERGDEQK